MINDPRQAAFEWASRGFKVFPLQANSKIPLAGLHWKELTCADESEAWGRWSQPQFAASNIGVHCVDMVVVDVDEGKHPGALDSYLALELPVTLAVSTPSGGYHFYFSGPDISNSASKIAQGIDIRGCNGYVVAPGSRTPAGVYTVDIDSPVAAAPASLIARCNAGRESAPLRNVDWSEEEPHPGRLADARGYLLDPQTRISVEGSGGDQTAFEVIAVLWDKGIGAAAALEILAEVWNERCLPPWPHDALRSKVSNVYNYASGPFGGRAVDIIFGGVALSENEHVIEIRGGNLPAEADAGEAALVAAGAPVFSRAGEIVRPYTVETEAFRGGRTHHAAVQIMNSTALVDELTAAARWERRDARSQRSVQVNAPKQVAETIISRKGRGRLRKLASVISTQTLRPDGSILYQVGYDEETRLFLMEPPMLPAIPEHPTRRDAEKALALLEGLLSEFPFASKVSRSVALSAILTTVCRGVAKVVPMHVSTAPTAGTGKSYLWDIVSMIATGQCCPVTAMPNSADELEKRIDGSLLEGSPIICIDNVNGELSGDKLCQAIERPVVEVRRLGASEKQKIDNRATFLATGNNIILRGDLNRRALLVSLDAKMARPELKQFHANPVKTVADNRGLYIAAALTIVRAYIVEGRPSCPSPLASFEQWSDNIRSSIIWLDLPDPLESMVSAREEDPDFIVRRELFGAILSAYPNGATAKMMLAYEAIAPVRFHDLHDSIMEHLATKGANPSEVLGKWLRSNKGQIVNIENGDFVLDGSEKATGAVVKWRIRSLEQGAGG